MNQSAQLYIYGVSGLGLLAVGAALLTLQVNDPALFALLAALAILGGALKMRVPGVNGNLSLSFLPMILSSVMLSLQETVLLTVAATLVQATVGVKKRKPIQIVFNCAALALSIAAGALAGQIVANQRVPLIRVALVGAVFYTVNMIAITTVIGLVGNEKLGTIWNECFRLYLPYFASGLACALIAFTGGSEEHRRALQYPGLAVLPLMLLARHYFKTFSVGANQRA